MRLKLDYVLELLQPDYERIELGKRRQSAIWRREEPDYTPIIPPPVRVPEKDTFPSYNLKEQFYDKEKMLIAHLWDLVARARTPGDGQLSMRANLGTGFVPTIFGLNQLIFEDKMPWLKEHLSKDVILFLSVEEFTEEKVKNLGLVPIALEYISYFKEKLDGKAHVYLSDTQGPLDIAHLVFGDTLFTEIYDDPEFVHHLLKLSTQAYISVSKVLKDAVGEELNSGYHGAIYMENGGVRCCEDTTTLLSPRTFDEFIAPYISSALRPFGGGWVHFCGRGHQFLEKLLSIPEVKGINFGNPEMYDYYSIMNLILDKGKFYVGGFPRFQEETLKDYFERILSPLKERGTRKGLIFMPSGDDLPEWQEPERIVELWYLLQDKQEV
jgi:hypothetical protein